MVAVSILAVGDIAYALAAREAIHSVLDHTSFDVHVTCDEACGFLVPNNPRVKKALLPDTIANCRADPFLAKFLALRRCVEDCSDPIVIHLDADAVVVEPLSKAAVESALGSSGMAMVEQTTITGSQMRRPQFLQHYADHSLRFIAPDCMPPGQDEFRFYNSGVILFRRDALIAFLDWAESRRKALPPLHAVGSHMIADQDYFQVWANNVSVGSCRELPWEFNHCEHWDTGFPRPGAKIAHLSNFCNGPAVESIERLRDLRGGAPGKKAVPAHADLTFVIVTFNSEQFLDACLEAASRLGRVVVVDNGSSDRSRAIAARWGAKIIGSETNAGFAAAANAGAKEAATRFVCFLNPDCLVNDAAADAALTVLSEDPRRLVVPNYSDWSGKITPGRQPGYSRTKVAADMLEADGLFSVAGRLRRMRTHHDNGWAWPLGACLFVGRAVFFELGGFDVRYFCYMEDVDLGWRAAKIGVPTVGLDTPVLHLEQKGAGVSPEVRKSLLDAARLQFAKRNYGMAFCALTNAARRLLLVARRPAAGQDARN